METIELRGVRVHNLRDVDLDIPRGRLTVITGVSGSGKSSLAFDTLYAEGQRRYVESLSTYARQFLERMDRPDADVIGGIPPAVAIRQSAPSSGGRSTVGTVTEITDYLRLLWARIGRTHCVRCDRQVEVDTVEKIADRFLGEASVGCAPRADGGVRLATRAAEGIGRDDSAERLLVCYPVDARVAMEQGTKEEFLAELRSNGFMRVRLNSKTLDLAAAASRKISARSRLAVVVDRLAARPGSRQRLVEALETAYRFGHERCLVVSGDGIAHVFSRDLHCTACDVQYRRLTPASFSFNSPLGACPECQGFGRSVEWDMDLIIPDRSKTIRQRPFEPWNFPSYSGAYDDMEAGARKLGVPLDMPYRRLRAAHRRYFEKGNDDFYGIKGFFEWLESNSYKVHVRVLMSRFRAYRTCKGCSGGRLRPEALAVRVNDRNVADVSAMTTEAAAEFFRTVELTSMEEEIARPVLKELERRLSYLVEVGLEYITLDRLSRTLSGGEAQRIHLATALGSGLTGTLYVLDEPSIGLHARDNDRLIRILKSLRDLGNTVVVVEHDPAIIRAADRVIDLGPAAGEHGGRVVAEGSPAEIAFNAASVTGKYLSGAKTVPAPSTRRKPPRGGWITLHGARANNLKDITVKFPLGVLCCVTGVSGSGKSSLVGDTLYPALRRAKGESPKQTGLHEKLSGADQVDLVVLVDQSAIGRTPRSTPASYIGAFAEIRQAFAKTEEAVARRLVAGDFSFNRPGGRCEACQGQGVVTAEMHFLADVTLTCEACGGSRYKDSTLAVRLRGRSISDVLHMTASEAAKFFDDRLNLVRRLSLLVATGLGYLRLGQPTSTLSGGEAQRLKLAEAMSHGRGRTLYLFDEPTTGLHLDDVTTLLGCFDRLLERGHSVLVVEHHLDVIRAADWIIDLGPEAADRGGSVVATGPPEKIMARGTSLTGRALVSREAPDGDVPQSCVARAPHPR